MLKSGLTRRFILYILIVVLTSLALLGIYLLHYFRENTIEAEKNALILNARIIEMTLENRLYQNNDSLNDLAEQISAQTALRITILDDSGKVLADTSEPAEKLDNHLQRSEVQAALQAKDGLGTAIRYSQTLHENLLYVAIPVYQNNRFAGIIRTSTSLAPMEKAYNDIARAIIIALLLSFVAAIVMALLLAKRQRAQLKRITRDALAIASGDLERRLIVHTNDEFDLLSHTINKLTNNLSRKIRESRAETHKLSLILDHMDNAVMLLSASGDILETNRWAQKVFRIKAKPRQHSIHVIGSASLSETASKVASSQKSQTITLHIKQSVFKVYLSSYCHDEQAIVVAVFGDISLLHEMAERQTAFTGNAAHELATPLTAISGFAEMLRDENFTDLTTTHHFADIIYQEAQRMNRLIKDLLQLAKLDNAAYCQNLPRQPIDCNQILQNTLKGMQPLAQRKQQNLTGQLSIDNPKILATPDLLEQIIRNLTENALKYTPEKGHITLACQATATQVIISIKDTGIGIPAEHLPRIFDRFYRVDKARDRKTGGNGIGLSLVKFLTELFGGKITVQSEPNSGTTFYLTFPRYHCS